MSQEAVSIKGTRNGLVIIFNPDGDIDEIKNNLKMKMETSGGFFKGAKFTVYGSGSDINHMFIAELEGICRQYGLIPSGEVTWPPSLARDEPKAAPRRKQSQVIPIRQQQPGGEQALLINRTIRSGQRVTSDHNVVVMGDVNPGAEIISAGSIYVLGNCKGSVHAGCSGNLMSEIFALKLQPLSVRIGTIAADGKPASPDGPGVARVSRGRIIISKFSANNMHEC
ncbi:MAG: septum site-determining protein MinC [Bacillota bacterium]